MSNLLADGNIDKLFLLTVTLDPANVSSTNTTSEPGALTVNGLRVGDLVFVNKPSVTAGVGIVNARVSANNTLQLTWVNATAGAVNPASESYLLLVVRPKAGYTLAAIP